MTALCEAIGISSASPFRLHRPGLTLDHRKLGQIIWERMDRFDAQRMTEG